MWATGKPPAAIPTSNPCDSGGENKQEKIPTGTNPGIGALESAVCNYGIAGNYGNARLCPVLLFSLFFAINNDPRAFSKGNQHC